MIPRDRRYLLKLADTLRNYPSKVVRDHLGSFTTVEISTMLVDEMAQKLESIVARDKRRNGTCTTQAAIL